MTATYTFPTARYIHTQPTTDSTRLKIAGVPISEYALCYTDSESYDACISLSDYLSESCGYRLDATALTLAESPRIIIKTDRLALSDVGDGRSCGTETSTYCAANL